MKTKKAKKTYTVLQSRVGDWDIHYPTYWVARGLGRNAAKRLVRRVIDDIGTGYGHIGDNTVWHKADMWVNTYYVCLPDGSLKWVF